MDLKFQKLSNERLTIYLSGKINIENADDIEKSITDNIENIRELVLDFTDVAYISSSGLRMVLSVQQTIKAQNGSLYIKNANSDVKNVFDISGFQNFLNII